MAASRRILLSCFAVLFVSSFLIRVTDAEDISYNVVDEQDISFNNVVDANDVSYDVVHPDEMPQCYGEHELEQCRGRKLEDNTEDDDDDFDDTYKPPSKTSAAFSDEIIMGH